MVGAVAVASGGNDLLIGHPLEVIGHGLRAGIDHVGELPDHGFAVTGDRMQDPEPTPPVTAAELDDALSDPDIVVIDAQGVGGFDTAHLDGALDFALDDVVTQAAASISSTDQRVIVYCTDDECLGAEFVGTQLVEAGYTNLGHYPGGVDAWIGSGRPTSTGT